MKKKGLSVIALTLAIVLFCSMGVCVAESRLNGQSVYKNAVITFGRYEQDNNYNNGSEKIEWLVADVRGNQALLITKYAIDWRLFDTNNVYGVNWHDTELYYWLNNDFLYEAFNDKERQSLVWQSPTDHETGYVSIMSEDQARQYFTNTRSRIAYPTMRAVADGAWQWDNGGCWWWLRTLSASSAQTRVRSAVGVDGSGSIDPNGYIVNRTRRAVRPIIWVNVQ